MHLPHIDCSKHVALWSTGWSTQGTAAAASAGLRLRRPPCSCGQPSALLPSCTLASRRRAVLAQSTITVPRAVDGRMAPFLLLAAAPAPARGRRAPFRRRRGQSSGRHAQTYDTRVQSKIHSLANLAAARATCQPAAAAAHRPAAARTPRRMPGYDYLWVFGKGSLLRNEPQYPTKGYAPHSGRGGEPRPGGDNRLWV